jgi:hypothetical protein
MPRNFTSDEKGGITPPKVDPFRIGEMRHDGFTPHSVELRRRQETVIRHD